MSSDLKTKRNIYVAENLFCSTCTNIYAQIRLLNKSTNFTCSLLKRNSGFQSQEFITPTQQASFLV